MSKDNKRPKWCVYVNITSTLRSTVELEADYFRIIDGDAYFRNTVQHSYPQTVRVFARGHWCEIVEVQL